MATGAWDRFWIAGMLCIAITVMVEFARRLPTNRFAWWVAHGPTIAWAGLTLVPWFLALRSGFWPVPAHPTSTVPLTLPETYGYNLLALVSLSFTTILFALAGQKKKRVEGILPLIKIDSVRAAIVIVVLFATYVVSSGSLSNIWMLSSHTGQDIYSNSRGASFLNLSIVVLTGLALAFLADQRPPSRTGILLYLGILLLALGSVHRYLVMTLILAYLIIQNPLKVIRFNSNRIMMPLLMLALSAWLIAFTGLGQLSAIRSGIQSSTADTYTKSTIASLDVISSSEYILESGVEPGQLHYSSYIALPAELVPRAVLGSRTTPPSMAILTDIFGPIGASAPLWMEGVLNLGALGDVASMVIVAALWCLAFRYASASRRQLGQTAIAIGPAWILILYQALSRILMIEAIDVCGSVIVGLLLWTWIQGTSGRTSRLVHSSIQLPTNRQASSV